MFCLRRLFRSAKAFYFALFLFCADFAIVTCKQCSVDVENQLEFEACCSNRGNFDANSPDIVDGRFSSESKHSVQQHSVDNLCPPSDSFCFPSTLTGLEVNEIHAESEFQSEGFSPGSKKMRLTLSWSPHHGIFNFLDGRNISCSLCLRDGFNELLSSDPDTKNRQRTDASSCISPLFENNTEKSKSSNSEVVNSDFVDGSSRPPVVIEPSLLDWGQKSLYHPSLAFLTVKNVDKDTVLSVYDPYSSSSQFYPCNFSEMLLAPGEVASICFVFFPTELGLSSAQLVLQTSLGGFLIQAKGFAVESPYLIKPTSDVSSSGRWRKNLSLFNPFDETLYVEEVTAWISASAGNNSRRSKAICHIHALEQSDEYRVLTPEEWLTFGRDGVDLPEIVMKPHKNWDVKSQTTETVMELDVSYQFEGKIAGAFCLQLLRPSNSELDTVIVPLEAELVPNSDSAPVSAYLEALRPCNRGEPAVVALSIRNNAPYLLSIIKVSEVGSSFKIKFVEGLVLFPGTITRVAILNYAREETPEVNLKCKLLILSNDTRNSVIEIPCTDVFSACSEHSSVGYLKWNDSIDNINGGKTSFSSTVQPPPESKALNTREADEFVLRNWKSQATASSVSVLDVKELVFPMVQIGNYGSQWIVVKNPSQKPVVMQLILNSGEVIHNCRASEMLLQPSSPSILLGNKSMAPTRYGFSIAKGALTEAFIHPYGSASLGPILFQPSNRCEWRSSVLIRNNLSGVEWLPLRGFGGSVSLVLLEGSDLVKMLEFKANLPSQLNYSSPEIVAGKIPSCSQALKKEVYAKNMGDLPVEVIRIEVSGAECGLDGFLVENCKGFSLQPGESVKLWISYQTDFSAATIQRDLELALATGILVIPMKASLPIYMFNFCKKSLFWIRLKKSMLMILLAAFLMYLLVSLLFPLTTAFVSRDFKNGESSSSALVRTLNSFHKQINWKSNGSVSLKLNGFIKSFAREEALLLESASRCCSDDHAPADGHVNPSVGHENRNNQQETILSPTGLTKASSFDNSATKDSSDIKNLRVRVGKEKGRRRKKKKNSGAGAILLDVSSSQSGNSTPSSPLSPVPSTTPKRHWPLSPGVEQSVDRVPGKQFDKSKCAKQSSKVNLVDNVVSLGRENNSWGFTAEEKPGLTRKVAGRAVLLQSATFPSASKVAPPWTGHSPYLASKSSIAPHARAPGTKLHSPKPGELDDKGIDDKFTYDIWGNHLFGPSLNYPSKEVSPMSLPPIDNNSDSFFVRGPQTLMKKSLLKPVSSYLKDNNE